MFWINIYKKDLHAFFYKQRQAKNKAKANQHPEAELPLFENYSLSYPRYQPKIIEGILKNVQKKRWVCFNVMIT